MLLLPVNEAAYMYCRTYTAKSYLSARILETFLFLVSVIVFFYLIAVKLSITYIFKMLLHAYFQIPQFLLDDWLLNWESSNGRHVEIVCTQPRRLSAIGVAERVAEERAERIGDTVGYQVTQLLLCKSTAVTFNSPECNL
jgi:hypothetical protein